MTEEIFKKTFQFSESKLKWSSREMSHHACPTELPKGNKNNNTTAYEMFVKYCFTIHHDSLQILLHHVSILVELDQHDRSGACHSLHRLIHDDNLFAPVYGHSFHQISPQMNSSHLTSRNTFSHGSAEPLMAYRHSYMKHLPVA